MKTKTISSEFTKNETLEKNWALKITHTHTHKTAHDSYVANARQQNKKKNRKSTVQFWNFAHSASIQWKKRDYICVTAVCYMIMSFWMLNTFFKQRKRKREKNEKFKQEINVHTRKRGRNQQTLDKANMRKITKKKMGNEFVSKSWIFLCIEHNRTLYNCSHSHSHTQLGWEFTVFFSLLLSLLYCIDSLRFLFFVYCILYNLCMVFHFFFSLPSSAGRQVQFDLNTVSAIVSYERPKCLHLFIYLWFLLWALLYLFIIFYPRTHSLSPFILPYCLFNRRALTIIVNFVDGMHKWFAEFIRNIVNKKHCE